MNEHDINLEVIKTKAYRASFLSRYYIPFGDFSGFLKKKKEIILFSGNEIEKFNNHDMIRIYHITKETVDDLRKRYRVLNPNKSTTIITKLDKEYFLLNGSVNKEKRNVINKYVKNNPISIQSLPNSTQEVKEFLKYWKEKRKVKYNEKMMFTGYDLNFITKYLEMFKDNLITKFYYYQSKLVGMTIIEKVDDNFYNLLIRKADPELSQLTYYIDFSSFKEIFEKSDKSVIINLGIDSGDKGIHEYKTKKFPVCKEIITYNIKISFKKKEK
jgi:hypothetical protein